MPDTPEAYFHDFRRCEAIWQDLSEDSLLFRGAANASVPEANRPCSKSLLRRVHNSLEFLSLFRRLVLSAASKYSFPALPPLPPAAAPNPPDSPWRTFRSFEDLEQAIAGTALNEEGVIADLALAVSYELRNHPEFATLLLETAREASSWLDLFATDYDFKERVHSFLEKLFSTKHPASRAASSVFLGAVGVLFASKAVLTIVPDLLDKNLSIPIRATLEAPEKEVKLKFVPGEVKETVALKIVPDKNNPAFPIRFQSDAPVDVQFTSKHPVSVAFQAKNPLTIPTDFVSKSSLHPPGAPCPSSSQLTLDTSNLLPAAVQLRKDIQALGEWLKTAHDDELKLGHRVSSLEDQVIQVDTQSKLVDQDFSNVLATTSVDLPENGEGKVLLQWLSERGSSRQCKVTVHASRKDSTYNVTFTPEDCLPTSQQASAAARPITLPFEFQVNEPQDLTPLPFHVQITEAVHHWYGGSHVTFRFQPNARHRLPLPLTSPEKGSTVTSVALPQFDSPSAGAQSVGKEKLQ